MKFRQSLSICTASTSKCGAPVLAMISSVNALTPTATTAASEGKACRITISMPETSKHHHTPYRFPGVHQIKPLVDVFEFQLVRDQVVDVDPAVHVPVDDFRHVAAALGAAEGGTFPHPAGDQLERPGFDLLARASDADDNRHAPALVAALQRLAHHVDVAY